MVLNQLGQRSVREHALKLHRRTLHQHLNGPMYLKQDQFTHPL